MSLSCAGLILSGGMNSRMKGRNKAYLEVGGFRFLDRVTRTLKQCFDEILLVTKDPAAYEAGKWVVIQDRLDIQSPLSGIHAGLSRMSCDYAFCVGCDTPFLKEGVVALLTDAIEPESDIVVPYSGTYYQPLCAIYSRRCAPFIESRLRKNDLKVDNLFARVNVKTIPYDTLRQADDDLISFFNVNTPEDLRYAEQLLAAKRI